MRRLRWYNSIEEAHWDASGIHKINSIRNTPLSIIKAENNILIGPNAIDGNKVFEKSNIVLAKNIMSP